MDMMIGVKFASFPLSKGECHTILVSPAILSTALTVKEITSCAWQHQGIGSHVTIQRIAVSTFLLQAINYDACQQVCS